MNKKYFITVGIVFLTIVSIILIIFSINKKEIDYPDDENTLYSVKFDNIILRFERYDYVLGENQLVGVQKSTNHGKDYVDISEEGIVVSMEPKFIFFDEKFGFAIKKTNNNKENGVYYGIYVTNDGGRKFELSKINYDNPNIEVLTIEDVPYYEDKILKLPCSAYQIKEDNSGYEDKKLIFVSRDNGLTWNLE